MTEIYIAGTILTCFRKQLVRFYGDKSETFNAHTLSHLSDQGKQCGPLSSTRVLFSKPLVFN